jgi:predicted RNA-binding Zn ribbon-like protein
MNSFAARPFELNGGHVALDFINTLDNRFHPAGPIELLPSYAELWRFLTQSGLAGQRPLTVTRQTDAAFRAAIRLRESAAIVFYGATDSEAAVRAARGERAAALRALETFFVDAACHQELSWSHGETHAKRLEWAFRAAEADPRLPVWLLASQCEQLLTSDAMAHVRTCEEPHCRWLFLDTSKNQRRRWCDMKICGNRVKARRFQAKRER